MHLRQGRDKEALEETARALKDLPSDSWVLAAAAATELTTGSTTRAAQLLETIPPAFRDTRQFFRTGGPGIDTYSGYLRLHAGERREADAFFDKSLDIDRRAAAEGNEDWSVPFDTACVQALRGQKDEAFRSLDKAVEAGWRGWPLGTRLPLLDPLRSDPHFKALEARLAGLVLDMRRRAGFR